jgi:hypothetical protein
MDLVHMFYSSYYVAFFELMLYPIGRGFVCREGQHVSTCVIAQALT